MASGSGDDACGAVARGLQGPPRRRAACADAAATPCLRTLYQAYLGARPRLVLLAEDDREMRCLLALALERDGHEALATLREAEGAPPFIVITAFGDAETHAAAHRLGAVAVFDKPFSVDDLRTAASHFASSAPRGEPAARLRIIIADDQQEMRDWLKVALAPLDADLQEARNGTELLRLLAERGAADIDIVIADVRMPPPDGLDVLARVRAAGQDLPFLVISGFADEAVRARAASLGAAVLAKPFTANQVRAQVRQLLQDGTAGPKGEAR